MPRRNPTQDRKQKHRTPGRNKSRRSKLANGEDQTPQWQPANQRRPVIVVCPHGKKGFTEHEARRRLEKVRANPQPGRPLPVRVYHCGLCDAWHMTSKATPPTLKSTP